MFIAGKRLDERQLEELHNEVKKYSFKDDIKKINNNRDLQLYLSDYFTRENEEKNELAFLNDSGKPNFIINID